MLDWQEIQDKALPERRLTALTDLSAVLVWALAGVYHYRENWTFGEDEITDAQWDEIENAIGTMEFELMTGFIGSIIPHVLADISSLKVLPCNGASYLRSDYPLLYDAIDPVYHIDADNFRVPDMREKFPLGESLNFALDDTGGEAEHVLSVDEMPSHSHTSPPHSHSEVSALPALADLGTGVPVPSATPLLTTTGFASVTIDNTGGSQAHNNMPPFLTVRWLIVAG